MTSKAQLRANRINAIQSTGPKTGAGKRKSSMNALKHGLTAKKTVVGDEDPEEFQSFHDALVDDFRPIGVFQHSLVTIIADALWKIIKRIGRMEAALIRKELEVAEAEYRRCHFSEKSAVRELRAKIEAMASRLTGSENELPRAPSECTREVSGEENEIAQLPDEARVQCQDYAFAVIFNDNKLSNLSRYQTSLMNVVVRNIQLLRLLQLDRTSDAVQSGIHLRGSRQH